MSLFAEYLNDNLLSINTTGRDDAFADDESYPYEPTPYCVLERLADSGFVTKEDYLIDFGCGKGRTCFYLNDKCGCKVQGIESIKDFFDIANSNLAENTTDISFVNANAENYDIPDDATIMYFFNPFADKILRQAIENIVTSYYRNSRRIYLMFYYPSDEYISILMSVPELVFLDEIDCNDLFEEDTDRNRIMIWQIG